MLDYIPRDITSHHIISNRSIAKHVYQVLDLSVCREGDILLISLLRCLIPACWDGLRHLYSTSSLDQEYRIRLIVSRVVDFVWRVQYWFDFIIPSERLPTRKGILVIHSVVKRVACSILPSCTLNRLCTAPSRWRIWTPLIRWQQ